MQYINSKRYLFIILVLFVGGCSFVFDDTTTITKESNSNERGDSYEGLLPSQLYETSELRESEDPTFTSDIVENYSEPTIAAENMPSGKILFYSDKSEGVRSLKLPQLEDVSLLIKESENIFDLLYLSQEKQIMINSDSGIEIYDLKTGSHTWLDDLGIWASDMVLSPDEKEVLFIGLDTKTAEPNRDLYIFNISSKKISKVTSDGIYKDQAEWSPDGKQIAYIASKNSMSANLILIDKDGSNKQILIQDTVYELGGLSWNPNEETITITNRANDSYIVIEYYIKTKETVEIPIPDLMELCFKPIYSIHNEKLFFLCMDAIGGSSTIYVYQKEKDLVEAISTFENRGSYGTTVRFIATRESDFLLATYYDGTNKLTSDLFLVDVLNKERIQLTYSEIIDDDFIWVEEGD